VLVITHSRHPGLEPVPEPDEMAAALKRMAPILERVVEQRRGSQAAAQVRTMMI
jgi:hypothetical protein